MARSIRIIKDNNGKYLTQFWEKEILTWIVESYIIVSHEVMVAWIENSILPPYKYT
jgi:hypothetical protein